jgi:hypothetical protein
MVEDILHAYAISFLSAFFLAEPDESARSRTQCTYTRALRAADAPNGAVSESCVANARLMRASMQRAAPYVDHIQPFASRAEPASRT